MSAALHLAATDDMARLLPLVAASHELEGIGSDEDARQQALAPLLEGSPHGCVYLIGPKTAPLGYIAIAFGWSIEFGGLDGFIDEFFIRDAVRGRGVGSEVLNALLPKLDAAGVRALHLEAAKDRPRLARLYARAGFQARDGYTLMTRARRVR